MNELLKVSVNENQEQTISGRELHMFLGIETPYMKWFERMLPFGFDEGKDFWTKMSKSTGGRPSTDHVMKLDMAKELCMLARNEKGKEARQYFLEVEREWNSPEKVMARALKIADKQISTLKAENSALTLENAVQKQVIAELKPIKDYVDTILSSRGTVLISQIAADYGISGKKLNKILNQQHLIYKMNKQWLLYAEHRNKGYTESETVNINLKDGPNPNGTVMHTRWTQKGRLKIHEILTSLGYVANMDREKLAKEG